MVLMTVERLSTPGEAAQAERREKESENNNNNNNKDCPQQRSGAVLQAEDEN